MREVCIAGVLQQKDITPKSFLTKLKPIYLPEKVCVFCIHDDRLPFLELYGSQKEISSHVPQKVIDLWKCSYVIRTVDDDRTFAIGFEDNKRNPLELTALTTQEREDWIAMLTFKLNRLNCLPSLTNEYGPLPFSKNARVFPENVVTFDSTPFYDRLSQADTSSNPRNSESSLYEPIGSSAPVGQEQQIYEHLVISNIATVTLNDRQSDVVVDSRQSSEGSNGENVAKSLRREKSLPPVLPKRALKPVSVDSENEFPDEHRHDYTTFVVPANRQSPTKPNSTATDYTDFRPSNIPVNDSGKKTRSVRENGRKSDDFNANAVCSTSFGGDFNSSNPEINKGEGNYVNVQFNNNSSNDSLGQYSPVPWPKPVVHPKNSQKQLTCNNDCNVNDIHNGTGCNNIDARDSFARNSSSSADSTMDENIPHVEETVNIRDNVDVEDDREEVPIPPLSLAPPVPPRNESSFAEHVPRRLTKIKANEVTKLRREIASESGIKVSVSIESAIKGLALVEFNRNIWVAGWNVHFNHSLAHHFHIGDQLISIDNRPVPSSLDNTLQLLSVLAFTGPVEIVLKRLPYGKTFLLERTVEGENLGLVCKKGKNEVRPISCVRI